jgi:hypothetical protein
MTMQCNEKSDERLALQLQLILLMSCWTAITVFYSGKFLQMWV